MDFSPGGRNIFRLLIDKWHFYFFSLDSDILYLMDTTAITSLEDLGYNEFFESARMDSGFSEYPVARVLAEYRGAYRVKNANGEYLAKITGKQMFTATNREDYPAVGDWVVMDELPDGKAVIRAILPRKTILQKKYSNKQENQIIATNIDTAFLVESIDRDYSLNRFERYLILTKEAKILPIIILNKIDLISESDLNVRINQIKSRFDGIEVVATSIVTDIGTRELENYIISGRTYCFLGSSGVGKSSLINTLMGIDEIKTREINTSLERGKHTTTTREMYFMEKGGLLIDNPGMREVGIIGSDMGLDNVFDEIGHLAQNCKYADCTHTGEPGCAVLKAVKDNVLDNDRFDNYIKLKKESEFYQMTELEKREKDRKFGKFIKKALQELRH
jgi:ribosome biogenesis GTPase / thiamine phosphate phosphatase